MKLYYFAGSPYSQKVLIALIEKDIDVEKEHVNLFDRKQMEQFKTVHPIGKLPVLKLDQRLIPESTVIIEYLESRFPDNPNPLIPKNLEGATDARIKTALSDNYLVPPARDLYFQGLRALEKQNKITIKTAKRMLDRIYQQLEQAVTEQKWMAGNAFTMADCAIAPALIELAHYVYPVPDDLPGLHKYMEQSLQRPSIAKVQEQVVARRNQGENV